MHKFLRLWIFAGLVLVSCKKDTYLSGNAFLSISSDTVSFGTLFTSTGSVTKTVRIINPNNQKLLISDISLMGGAGSPFLLNINGSSGPSSSNLSLDANDSIYLFIAVYVPSGSQPKAFLLQDSIRIRYNGSEHFVQLNAVAQNAHFLKNKIIQGNVRWSNDLPYVILGGLQVESHSVLTISAGCQIYFHAGAGMQVDGSLRVMGEAADSLRVYFTGDRLDEPYASYPGAWPGIDFSEASTGNEMQYAVLRNGSQSIVVEGPTADATPKLILNQCIIDNALVAGMTGIGTRVDASNCLISNCAKNIVLAAGGTYNFLQCTAASFSTPFLQHQQPVLTISDAVTDGNPSPAADLQAIFTNCIFWGDPGVPDEALITREGTASFQVLFDHAILKQEHYPDNTDSTAVLLNTDPLFMKADNERGLYDFHLQSGSPAAGGGRDGATGVDLDGHIRTTGKQDLGCYERQ